MKGSTFWQCKGRDYKGMDLQRGAREGLLSIGLPRQLVSICWLFMFMFMFSFLLNPSCQMQRVYTCFYFCCFYTLFWATFSFLKFCPRINMNIQRVCPKAFPLPHYLQKLPLLLFSRLYQNVSRNLTDLVAKTRGKQTLASQGSVHQY